MRILLTFMTLLLLFPTGCRQPASTTSRTDQLAAYPIAYDPSVVAFDERDNTAWNAAPSYEDTEPESAVSPAQVSPPAGGRTHVVRAKDTLYGLARQYYQDQTRWKTIYEANRDKISDPNKIKVGMTLVIP